MKSIVKGSVTSGAGGAGGRAASRDSVRRDDGRRAAAALHAAVSDLVRVYQFRDRDRICCHDISVTQCYALELLAERGPLRMGALAEQLFLDKSTTSRVVTTLVRKGYVEQKPDAADGRAVALSVTRAGRGLYERITDDLVEQQEALLSDLDPALRDGVTRVIRRLAEAADARFRSGISVGAGCCTGETCAPSSGDAPKRSRSGADRSDDRSGAGAQKRRSSANERTE
jgi:MarR family transcriptional regulator, 2-MHQ and catechol-resistance regulon repressor